MVLDMDRGADVFAALRALVEEGQPDQPVTIRYDGKPCLEIRSLHRAALLRVTEEPTTRFTDWHPHPRAQIGPRLAALVEARAADRRLRREYGC